MHYKIHKIAWLFAVFALCLSANSRADDATLLPPALDMPQAVNGDAPVVDPNLINQLTSPDVNTTAQSQDLVAPAQSSPAQTEQPTAAAATPLAAANQQLTLQPGTAMAARPIVATSPLQVEVVNGRSFRDLATGRVIQLYGIDTCQAGQTAVTGNQHWFCAVPAMSWLITATLNKWVVCTPVREEEAATVARCATGEYRDLAAEMLNTGLAINSPDKQDQLIRDYAIIEAKAKTSYRGLWSATFENPWIYRAANKPVH